MVVLGAVLLVLLVLRRRHPVPGEYRQSWPGSAVLPAACIAAATYLTVLCPLVPGCLDGPVSGPGLMQSRVHPATAAAVAPLWCWLRAQQGACIQASGRTGDETKA